MSRMVRILIVDDDQDVLIELERILENEGYSTATAWSGREALHLSERADFDLVLVDEHLSDLDSDTLLPELARKQPKAVRLMMSSGKGKRPPAGTATPLCKWEHGEMKARIRSAFQRSA